jgi:hypothetical protein
MVSLADVLDAQAQVESGGNPRARSYKNAQGLHQFLPATWKQYGNGKDINDPVANRDAAARMLTDLYQKHGSLPLALAAYNGGDGGANFLRKNPALMHHPDKKAPINQWRNQTADYVNKIMTALNPIGTAQADETPYQEPAESNADEWEDVTPRANTAEAKTQTPTTDNTADEWEDVTPTAEPIQAAQPEQKQPMSWGDVASGAVSNIIPSTGRMIGGLAEAAMHPIDTANAALDVGAGAISNMLPESLQQEGDKKGREMASQLADVYKQRYGTMDGFKEVLANDPASIMMDASMLAGGVGAGARAANLPSVASLADKAAVAVNPLTLPVKATIATAKAVPKVAGAVKNASITDLIGANPERIAENTAKKANAGLMADDMSLSAAEASKAAQRQAMAEELGFTGDAALTEGQLRRDPTQQAFESDMSKMAEGAPLVKRTTAQEKAIHNKIDQFFEETGAEAPDLYQAGDKVASHVNTLAKEAKRKVQAAYKAASESPEGARPVKLDELVNYINENRSSAGTAKILGATKRQLLDMGWATRDPMNKTQLVANEVPLKEVEKLRQTISKNTGFEAPDQYHSGNLRKLIDETTDATGGDLYKSAREMHRGYAETFKNTPIIADLIKTKRGTNQRAIALEDVYKKTMLNSSYDSAATVKKLLTGSGEDGIQAWNELKGRVIANIAEDAKRIIAPNAAGESPVSVAGINKLVTQLDKSGKLDLFFEPKQAEQLRSLVDITKTMLTHPAGAVNTSNTGRVVMQMLTEAGLSGMTTGIPIPVLSLGKALHGGVKSAQTRAKVEAALRPSLTGRAQQAAESAAYEPPAAAVYEPFNPLDQYRTEQKARPEPKPKRSLADALKDKALPAPEKPKQLGYDQGGDIIKFSDGSTSSRADRVNHLIDNGMSKQDAARQAQYEIDNPKKPAPQPTKIRGKGTIRLGSDKPKVKQLPPERIGETVKNERGTFEKFASEQEAADFAEAHGISGTHEPKMLFGAYQLNAKPKPSLADKITPPAQKGAGIKETDDLLTAIKKLGGIDAEIAEGIEKHSVISKTGRSYDDLAESLRDYGYDVTDANDLIEKVSRSVNQGEKIHTANGSAAKAAKDFKARSLADKLNNKQEK